MSHETVSYGRLYTVLCGLLVFHPRGRGPTIGVTLYNMHISGPIHATAAGLLYEVLDQVSVSIPGAQEHVIPLAVVRRETNGQQKGGT